MSNLSHLPPIQLSRNSSGHLSAQLGSDPPIGGVVPLRLFPLSEPDDWIALLDSTGRELAVIEEVSRLDSSSREILATELARREFVPVILRIQGVSGNSEPCSWQVETDRGNTEFVLKNEDDIRRLGPLGVLIVDSHGIRYLIPDRTRLDNYSRRIVEWYV